MLYDEIKEKLKHIEPDLQIIAKYWQESNKQNDLKKLIDRNTQEDFWQYPELAKQLQKLKKEQVAYLSTTQNHTQLLELVNLFADDEKELLKLERDVYKHAKVVSLLKIALLLNDGQDDTNCFLTINSGAGGTESQDWASMLLRMYTRFCEREEFYTALIDYQAGEEAGLKSATLFIKGENAYGLLKSEQGIHRLVRISPYDANKRRHTSFAGVFVTPEVPQAHITIDPKDLRIDTYRSGGAGGQHVNKTESAIRITHIPTNTVVQCQNERSQAQNKEMAMRMLMAKLVQKEKEEAHAKVNAVEKKKIEWGSQIRSYILHPYKLVKDHRSEYESGQPEKVLDGEIMDFIEHYLVASNTPA
jgi:peptide chain release factor 2